MVISNHIFFILSAVQFQEAGLGIQAFCEGSVPNRPRISTGNDSGTSAKAVFGAGSNGAAVLPRDNKDYLSWFNPLKRFRQTDICIGCVKFSINLPPANSNYFLPCRNLNKIPAPNSTVSPYFKIFCASDLATHTHHVQIGLGLRNGHLIFR